MTDSAHLRILVPGEDISLTPSLKLQRAQQLALQVVTEWREFRDNAPADSRVAISPDGRHAKVFADFSIPFPIHEWSLVFGDAIHNYRAALDGLAWELTRLDGQRPLKQHESKVYFPFARTRTDWEKLCSTTLSSIPNFVLERLDRVQPYRFEATDESIGVLLNRLDIADKHHSLLSLEVTAVERSHFVMHHWFEPGADPGQHAFMDGITNWSWSTGMAGTEDGDLVLEFDSAHPLARLEIPQLPLAMRVNHSLSDGSLFEFVDLLQHIDIQVSSTFQIVCDGDISEQQRQLIARTQLRHGEGAI